MDFMIKKKKFNVSLFSVSENEDDIYPVGVLSTSKIKKVTTLSRIQTPRLLSLRGYPEGVDLRFILLLKVGSVQNFYVFLRL